MTVSRSSTSANRVEQQNTPMIDVVFQLLTFFVMSFKVLSLEGDFAVKMPTARVGVSRSLEPSLPELTLRLRSDIDGNLASMKLNDRELGAHGWHELRESMLQTLQTVGGAGAELGASPELVLNCDYQLKYTHVIDAITYASGRPDGHGGVIKLVENIKFSPPTAESPASSSTPR